MNTDTDESDSDDYYNYDEDLQDEPKQDPEYFDYVLITQEDAENMLDCFVDETAKRLKVRYDSVYIDLVFKGRY